MRRQLKHIHRLILMKCRTKNKPCFAKSCACLVILENISPSLSVTTGISGPAGAENHGQLRNSSNVSGAKWGSSAELTFDLRKAQIKSGSRLADDCRRYTANSHLTMRHSHCFHSSANHDFLTGTEISLRLLERLKNIKVSIVSQRAKLKFRWCYYWSD